MKENKAIGFLEYATDRLQYVNTDMYNDLIKATEFYGQPFSPELIERYFESSKQVAVFYEYTENFGNPKTIDSFIIRLDELDYPITFSETALKELNK